MLFYTYLIIILLSLETSNAHYNEFKMANDFLQIQANSKQVLIYFCHSKSFISNFSKKLSNSLHSHRFLHNSEEVITLKHSRNLAIVLDLKCPNATEFIKKGLIYDLFGDSNQWLLFGHSISNNLYLPVDSKVFLASSTSEGYQIKTIFKYSESNLNLTEKYIGNWSYNKGFINYHKLSLPKDRLDLMGTPMKVSYYYNYVESIQHTMDFRNVQMDNLLKINYILLNHIANYLNASHMPAFTPSFGLNFDEKTQMYEDNSLLGDVQRGKTEVMGVTSWIEPKKLRFYRFFGPTTQDQIKFVFRAPSVSLTDNIYLMPFDFWSWHCIGAILIIGSGLLFIILAHESENPCIIDAIMIILSAFLQKSSELQFHSLSGRLSLAITYLTFLVIFNAYSASIILFLQGTTEKIRSFADLYEAGFEIGVHDVDYNRYYFLEPNDRTNEHWRNKVYKEKIGKNPNKFFLELNEGIDKMQKELFAFQSQVSSAHYLINKKFTQAQKCTVRYVPTLYKVDNSVYLGTKKNSSYFKHYKIGMRRNFEHGLHRRAFTRLFMMKLPCEGHIGYFSGIGIVETRFIVIVFVSGVLLSFVLLCMEVIVKRFRNSKRYYSLLRKLDLIYSYTE